MRTGLAVTAVVGLALSGCGDQAPATAGTETADSYAQQIAQWRSERMARLQAAEGWLSYTGSGRLTPGVYRVGSAAGNSLRLPAGPAHLGVLQLRPDGQASIEFAPGAGALVDGQPATRALLQPAVDIASAGAAKASRVSVDSGIFYLVRTGALDAWRYLETDPAKRPPVGRIDYYPVDRAWQVVAEWKPFDAPREVVLLTSIGTPQNARVPGEAVFTLEGKPQRLQSVLVQEPGMPDRLFFLFSDRTTGRKTFGGGRYLFADLPTDGQVVLDFNRAQNPPCAITPHVVCPLAPPSNRLDVSVTAGEQNYVPGN